MSNDSQVPKLLAACSECGKRFRIPDDEQEYACKSCGGKLMIEATVRPSASEAEQGDVEEKRAATTGKMLVYRRISFWSLVRLGGRIGTSAGLAMGPVALVSCLFGFPVKLGMGFFTISVAGMSGGLFGLVWLPLSMGLLAAIMAAIAYLPLRWWMSQGDGLRLELTLASPRTRRSRAA